MGIDQNINLIICSVAKHVWEIFIVKLKYKLSNRQPWKVFSILKKDFRKNFRIQKFIISNELYDIIVLQ